MTLLVVILSSVAVTFWALWRVACADRDFYRAQAHTAERKLFELNKGARIPGTDVWFSFPQTPAAFIPDIPSGENVSGFICDLSFDEALPSPRVGNERRLAIVPPPPDARNPAARVVSSVEEFRELFGRGVAPDIQRAAEEILSRPVTKLFVVPVDDAAPETERVPDTLRSGDVEKTAAQVLSEPPGAA